MLTIEFCFGTFSGNGVYAMSQVRALGRLGHDVMVICGCPRDAHVGSSLEANEFWVEPVSLPSASWGRLDVGCGWREFAAGCGNGELLSRVQGFLDGADVVLGIDWHSYVAYQRLALAMAAVNSDKQIPPYACSNYRMFSRSVQSEKDAIIVRELEKNSLEMGICCTVLSRSDEMFARETFFGSTSPHRLRVLLPALRADIASITPPQDSHEERRRFLLCCVRASPEKEPHRFVDLIIELDRRNVFNTLGIMPLVVGSGWNVGHLMDAKEAELSTLELYAKSLCVRVLDQVACCKIVDTFLSAEEMASIYAQTVLNIHPCLTDAYGMTVVEAASQGAPSLVHCGNTVGCTDLLKPECGQVIETDMSLECHVVADFVEGLLRDRPYLAKIGRAAMSAAREWDEEANATCLADYLNQSINQAQQQAQHLGIKQNLAGLQPLQQRNGIDVWNCYLLPYSTFVEKYLTARRPVILSGVARDWRASYDWVTERGCLDLTGMELIFKDTVVPVTNVHEHRDKDSSFSCTEMKFSEYCSWFMNYSHNDKRSRENGPLYYLKDWHMAAQFPDYEAYDCPIYFRDDWLNEWYDSLDRSRNQKNDVDTATNGNGCMQRSADYRFCYMGPSSSRTMLHVDVLHSHSWSANIAGRKVWQLLPPSTSHLVYDEHHTYHAHTLHYAELSAMDQQRFAKLQEANSHVIEIVQNAGEVLFVPSGWMHQVQNIEDCVSINHNFITTCSIAASWSYLRREYQHAADLIEDCRPLTSGKEFELLVQRNLQANAGLGYEDFGKLVRFIAHGAMDRLHEREASAGSYPTWLTTKEALNRLHAAIPILQDLVDHARCILTSLGAIENNNTDDAECFLESELVANQECLHAAASISEK